MNWAAPVAVGDGGIAATENAEGAEAAAGDQRQGSKEEEPDLSWKMAITDTYNLLWKLIIRPPRAQYDIASLGPPRFRIGNDIFVRKDLQLTNDRGLVIECSHFLPEDPSLNEGGRTLPCVIYLHGNCSCRLESKELLHLLLPRGVSLFSLDFAGSGHSEGDYISLGFFEQQDLKTVLKYLRSLPYISGIGLWGRSMGAATCVFRAAEDYLLGAMVMDSPFSNLQMVAHELVNMHRVKLPDFVFRKAMQMLREEIQARANFDINQLLPIHRAPYARSPALFCVASDDDFVLAHHTLDLHRAWGGNEKKLVTLTGGHNGSRPKAFQEEAADFLQKRLSAAPPPLVKLLANRFRAGHEAPVAQAEEEELPASFVPPPAESPPRQAPARQQLPTPRRAPAQRAAPPMPARAMAATPPPPPPNPAAQRALVAQIVAMGFSERQGIEASKRCRNVDDAMEWIFEYGNSPAEPSGQSHTEFGAPSPSSALARSPSGVSSGSGTRRALASSRPPSGSSDALPGVDPAKVRQLTELGCRPEAAEEAVRRSSTVEGAVEWLIARGEL